MGNDGDDPILEEDPDTVFPMFRLNPNIKRLIEHTGNGNPSRAPRGPRIWGSWSSKLKHWVSTWSR